MQRFIINCFGLILGTLFTITIIHISGVSDLFRTYFSFSQFVYTVPAPITCKEVFIIISAPIITGIVISLLINKYAIYISASSGFLAALIQILLFFDIWNIPGSNSWDPVVPPDAINYHNAYFLIYIVYLISYGFFGIIGGSLGHLIKLFTIQKGKLIDKYPPDIIHLKYITINLTISIVGGIISFFICYVIDKIYLSKIRIG